ncbi:MAG: glycosyltransferase [Phycisphaerales bacterium]
MQFSIVIPTFNRAALLAQALDSVLPQLDADAEVIVVDDGSSDATAAMFERGRDRVSFVRQENAGPGPARNRGAAIARGEYLCFLDADDLWFPWTLDVLRGLVAGAERPALISSMPVSFREARELAGVVRGGARVERHADYLAADPLSIFPGAGSMVVRREAFARSGGFASTRMGAEDAELFLRLGVEPGFAFVRSPALVAYRLHAGSLSTDIEAGLRGRRHMIDAERRGVYPGGAARRRDRRAIITSHIRSGTVVALRAGRVGAATRLYAAGFAWNAALARWKFLLGFPLLAARALMLRPDARASQGFLPGMPAPAERSPGGAAGLRASVVLATRNRKDELRRALNSCLAQSVPVEIVVRDDGSTDGTDAMMRAEFPMVNYARSAESRGSIPSRNEAVAAATGEIIFSIDDDAAFVSARSVEQTLGDFDHPRVGIVALPFIDVLKGDVIEQAAPEPTGVHVLDTYRGCAAAWRREAFLSVGGYTPILRHMAEEPDLSLRLLDRGYVVRAGRADPVHHFESPNRNWDKIWRQIARNGVLQGWMTAPWWMVLPHLLGTVLSSVRTGVRVGKPGVLLGGTLAGLGACVRSGAGRQPVSAKAYFLCRWLRRHKPARLEELEPRLPVLRP